MPWHMSCGGEIGYHVNCEDGRILPLIINPCYGDLLGSLLAWPLSMRTQEHISVQYWEAVSSRIVTATLRIAQRGQR